MAASASAATRCVSCGRGLAFEEWSHGIDQCPVCRESGASPRPRRAVSPPAVADAAAAPQGYRAYQSMVDDVPDRLIDELAHAIELEAAARRIAPRGDAADAIFSGLAAEMGIRRTPGQLQWTSWGFVAGFALNVGLMKYAQMATGVPMSAVMMPMFAGGLVAGVTCAVIGWGLARLRER